MMKQIIGICGSSEDVELVQSLNNVSDLLDITSILSASPLDPHFSITVSQADAVLIVLSTNSANSDICRDQWREALIFNKPLYVIANKIDIFTGVIDPPYHLRGLPFLDVSQRTAFERLISLFKVYPNVKTAKRGIYQWIELLS